MKRRITDFIRNNVNRLLLLAVLLLLGFSVNYVAQAKYADYLYDYTGAVAGDFCFSSDYLKDGDGGTFDITGWDGESFTLTVEMRNYENALRFNRADTPAMYYFVTDVFYQKDEVYNGKVNNFQASTYLEVTPKNDDPDHPVTAYYYKSGDRVYPCFLLEGMDTFNRTNGTQNIDVKLKERMDPGTGVIVNHMITMKAVSVSADMLGNVYTNPACTEKYTGSYTGKGVFQVTRSGKLYLKTESAAAIMEASLTPTEGTEMRYTLESRSLPIAGLTQVLIYFDKDRVKEDSAYFRGTEKPIAAYRDKLMTIEQMRALYQVDGNLAREALFSGFNPASPSSSKLKEMEEAVKSGLLRNYMFVNVALQSNSTSNTKFFVETSVNSNLKPGDITFRKISGIALTDADQEQYDIMFRMLGEDEVPIKDPEEPENPEDPGEEGGGDQGGGDDAGGGDQSGGDDQGGGDQGGGDQPGGDQSGGDDQGGDDQNT